jgi:C4-dicarboxylate-specific signal transduction histidine kinase
MTLEILADRRSPANAVVTDPGGRMSSAEAKLQKLTLSQASDIVVTADHDRLRQILVNVSVSTSNSQGVTWGEICVRDTGPGSAADEQEAVFEAYYRSPVTARAPGVGLSLAISRSLLEQMGGMLMLQSQPGAGSAFTIRLPAIVTTAS